MNVFSSRNDDDVEVHDFVDLAFVKFNILKHQSRFIQIRDIFEINVISFNN